MKTSSLLILVFLCAFWSTMIVTPLIDPWLRSMFAEQVAMLFSYMIDFLGFIFIFTKIAKQLK